MRKLVSIATLLTIVVHTNSQNFQQHYGFPPQFQTPSVGEYASEGSLYLPPETQTTLPYFPLKSANNLQYQYLPPTGTKAPVVYPSPFPYSMSSAVPTFDEDEEDDDDKDDKIHLSSPQPPNMFKLRPNRTQNSIPTDKKEMRSLPKTVMYNHPIERIDIKFPFKYGPTQPPLTNMQTPSNRRMIITPETVKSEPLMGDQMKTASYHGIQYLQPPPGFISSTTEPAIPIIRLSNEMDLDGSYSYEALGADQTHYVQHSRMENMGTEKEEQVVEGSYSYVGDNGQTYTVHYVADSNGFRASGDHLPVGPPIPEIIQRSIQYNLAEEAKRPPHLQNWHDEERNNEIDTRDRVQRLPLPPSRNLFTGRAPEAFSYNFAKLPQNNNNNLVPSPSSPTPVIAHLDQPKEQPPKQNNGPIAPQITFLASQGAHLPSMVPNPPQPQPIARLFNTNNDKAPMPKLMNYELTTAENEHENSKPLWRWQYGLNANAGKNLISRSSGYNEDEVTLNFNEMTPEQYRFMIHSQFDSNGSDSEKYEISQSTPATEHLMPDNHKEFERKEKPIISTVQPVTEQYQQPKEIKSQEQLRPSTKRYQNSWYNEPNNDIHNQLMQQQNQKFSPQEKDYPSKTPKLITQNDFIPPSQMVTQSYDYDESYYEPRKVRTQKSSVTFAQNKNVETENNIEKPKNEPTNDPIHKPEIAEILDDISDYTTPEDVIIKSKQWIPLTPFNADQKENQTISSTEASMDDWLKNNIFLRNVFNPNDNANNKEEIDTDNTTKANKVNDKILEEKSTRSLPPNHKVAQNPDTKFIRKSPMDMSDVLHYVATKNHFESSKIRPLKSQKNINFPEPNESSIFPHTKLGEEGPIYYKNDHRNNMNEHVQEKPAVVKKYKTLQRNNILSFDQSTELRRDLTPPPQDNKNLHNLPPLGRAGPTLKSYLPPIFV